MRSDDAVALATRTEGGPRRPDPEDGRPGWTTPPRFSFSNRSVDIDGQLIRYVDQGEGPPPCSSMRSSIRARDRSCGAT